MYFTVNTSKYKNAYNHIKKSSSWNPKVLYGFAAQASSHQLNHHKPAWYVYHQWAIIRRVPGLRIHQLFSIGQKVLVDAAVFIWKRVRPPDAPEAVHQPVLAFHLDPSVPGHKLEVNFHLLRHKGFILRLLRRPCRKIVLQLYTVNTAVDAVSNQLLVDYIAEPLPPLEKCDTVLFSTLRYEFTEHMDFQFISNLHDFRAEINHLLICPLFSLFKHFW